MTNYTKEQLIARINKQIDINSTIIERLCDDSAAVSELAVKTATLDIKILDIALASLEADSDSHPAHGSLSNYRLHRIREILGKAAAQRDGGNLGYAMSDAVKAFDELLEVRTAEPDYIRYDCGCCGWETIEDWRDNDVCPKCNHKPMCKTELFTAPPAPVVPDEMTMADAIMEIDAKDADRWTGRIGFQKGWNACRAAMLNGGKS